jgi:hypothetical protein
MMRNTASARPLESLQQPASQRLLSLSIDKSHFKDELGRSVLLRGVNVAGSSKVPFSFRDVDEEAFYTGHRDVSFVGRPFPRGEVEQHCQRLQAWGLTCWRLLVPWEAVEHAGPGRYDKEYLDYLQALVAKASEFGIRVFIDIHQDVWSRLCNGDGAPGWTLEAVGFEPRHFNATAAAHVDPFEEEERYREWPANYARLATATMFTLFFGGNDFAPGTRIDGEPVQEFLQRHYLGAATQVARRLKDLPNVLGFDAINEPSPGYIGWEDLMGPPGERQLRAGPMPTPLQAMALGAGHSLPVRTWPWPGLPFISYRTRLNHQRKRAWKEGRPCVWQENGVWDVDGRGRPVILRPRHFSEVNGKRVKFGRQYLRPFLNRFARKVREVTPRAMVFVQNSPMFSTPRWNPQEDAPEVVNASHWYDYFTLFTSIYLPFFSMDFYRNGHPAFGRGAVRKLFWNQLKKIKSTSKKAMGGVPTHLGEFGVPFAGPWKLNYYFNDFRMPTRALDASFQVIEAHLLNATLWNYTPDNTNARGDGWNKEDLSIFSRDQQKDPDDINSGARGLRAFLRPYPQRVAGKLLSLSYDMKSRRFHFTFRHDPAVNAPTECFIPRLPYPDGCEVEVSDGSFSLEENDGQPYFTLVYTHTQERWVHEVSVRPARR